MVSAVRPGGSISPGQGCHDDSRDGRTVTMPALLVSVECDRWIHTRPSLARVPLIVTDVALVLLFILLLCTLSGVKKLDRRESRRKSSLDKNYLTNNPLFSC